MSTCSKCMKRGKLGSSRSTMSCMGLLELLSFLARPDRAVIVGMKWIDEVSGTLNFVMNSLGISRSLSAFAFASLCCNSLSPSSPKRCFCAATREASSDFNVSDNLIARDQQYTSRNERHV